MNIPVGSSHFHLIVEPWPELSPPGPTRAGSDPRSPTLPVPSEVVALEPGPPPRWRGDGPNSPPAGVTLEPIALRNGQPGLLLVNAAAARLRVNDVLAPRLVLLRERDQFQFDESCVFHVTIFHRPQTGPAPADKIGKPCPICLAPFADDPNSVCYCCPCGTVLHLQDPTGLECARAVHDCPHCHQPISLKEGYAWLPNLES